MSVSIKSIHAAIDEINANGNKEALTALGLILVGFAKADNAVTVSASRKPRRAVEEDAAPVRSRRSAKAETAEDDDDLILDDEEEEEVKPARTRRAAKVETVAAKPSRRAAKVEVVEEEEEGDAVELAGLAEDDILDFMDAIAATVEISDELEAAGITQLNAMVKEVGHDPKEIAGEGKRSERSAQLRAFLASIDAAVDAIVEKFEIGDIEDAWAEITEEDLPVVKGAAKTKLRAMADAYVKLVIEPQED